MEDFVHHCSFIWVFLLVVGAITPFDVLGIAFNEFDGCNLHQFIGIDLRYANYITAFIAPGTIMLLFFSVTVLMSFSFCVRDRIFRKLIPGTFQMVILASLCARIIMIILMAVILFGIDMECTRQFSNDVKWTLGLWGARTLHVTAGAGAYSYAVHKHHMEKSIIWF